MTGPPVGPVEMLREASEARAEARDEMRWAIACAREAGMSWREVAEVLGVSRRAAQHMAGER